MALASVKVLVTSVVYESLRPYGLQPARLLCPWDSPGKNTGVGCRAPPPGGLPHPGIKAGSPALQADSLLTEPPRKPPLQLLGPRRTWGCLR